MVVIFAYLIVAVFAPLIAPYGEAEIFEVPFAPWSDEFLLGTVGPRYLYPADLWRAQHHRHCGGHDCAWFFLGGSLGLIAAINRSGDQGLSRFVDVLMAIPSLIFALMLLSIFGPSALNLIIIIAVLDATRVFRLTRAVALNVVVMDYIEVARLRGEGWAISCAAKFCRTLCRLWLLNLVCGSVLCF